MVKIDLIINEKNWLNFSTKKEIKNIAKRALNGIVSILKINIAQNVVIDISITLTNDKVIKNYNPSCHIRSMFASIARKLERTWYDFGTTLVRLWYGRGKWRA